MKSLGTEIRVVGLGLLTLLAVIAAVGNIRQERTFRLPDDGVFWMDEGDRVVASAISIGSPAESADLRVGDTLVRINGQPIREASQVSRLLFDLGVGARVRYAVLRQALLSQGVGGQAYPLELELALAAQPPQSLLRVYLRLVGVLYLLLGLFVLLRRFAASRATHFYLFCLASFVLFVFSYSGKLDTFDWAIYAASVAANLLVPALFPHFCLAYPPTGTPSASPGRRWLLVAIYGTAALLGAVHVAVALGVLRVGAPLLEIRWLLDRLEVGYLAAGFLAGIGWLAAAYRRASSRFLRKQIGWVLAGSVLGVVPFAALYAVPYFWGVLPRPWMNLSSLSLILLPLAFSYAIVRYRLLDVEILLRRGMAYTLATAMLVSAYLGVVALVGDFFRTYFPAAGTVGLVLAIIATGLLFQPLQRWIQSKLERYFLRNRYEYRQALLRFGRELSTQTDLNRLIASLVDQLVRTLRVKRAAVFVAEENEPQRFALRGAVGLNSVAEEDDYGFLARLGSLGDSARARERLFFAGWGPEIERELATVGPEKPSWPRTIARMQLHYYFACRSQNRLVAVLGLGATEEGELLSEEDVALVETLAGYLAVAVDNARLVESLAAKAAQYERLQQFSEDILESIPVGLVAVDLEGRIEAVNTPLRQVFSLSFADCRGRKLREVFPGDLIAQFPEDGGTRRACRFRNARGEERVLNILIAPLLSKQLESIGRLIIFDDVTERVALETQLAQAEKLSAVGALAAGVAHEVNTPLTVISTQAQMLAKQLPPGDLKTRIVEKIVRQTFRASEIVNSLLNFSRTKGSTFSPVEINKIVTETLLLLEHQFKTAGILVESRLEPGLPAISGSSDKLQQVFLNLFLNAKDAMPEGGRLRVATGTTDSVVRVEVSDTGAGIAPENLHRIYDPFFTTKVSGRGTGLGLAVSYGIIQEHSGKIQVASQPGLGTRFCLEFPILKQAVHA